MYKSANKTAILEKIIHEIHKNGQFAKNYTLKITRYTVC